MSFLEVLNNEEAKALVELIEDMLSSSNGEIRYAAEIQNCIDQIFELTGYLYTV